MSQLSIFQKQSSLSKHRQLAGQLLRRLLPVPLDIFQLRPRDGISAFLLLVAV